MPRSKNSYIFFRRLCIHAVALIGFSALTLLHLRPFISQWRNGLMGHNILDPLMNSFHLWWMRKVFIDGYWPYHTPFLHHPTGADMYWHTLAPIKSGWGVVLLSFFNPAVAYNVLVFGTFVFVGYVTWLFISALLQKAGYRGLITSFIAFGGACALTFSPYMLAHSEEHINLISIEGIVLFLLSYFLYKHSGSSVSLAGVFLSAIYIGLTDYYFILYTFIFIVSDCIYSLSAEGISIFSRNAWMKEMRRSLHCMIALILGVLPFLIMLLWHAFPRPINVEHGDSDYATDFAGVFLPNRYSFWLHYFPMSLQNIVMTRIRSNWAESSFFVGWFTVLIGGYAVWKNIGYARRFSVIACIFFVLSLGPFLLIAGSNIRVWFACILLVALLVPIRKRPWVHEGILLLSIAASIDFFAGFTVNGAPVSLQIPLPYLLLKNMLPFFDRGGMPARFMLMVYICIGVCFSYAMCALAKQKKFRFAIIEILVIALLVPNLEYMRVPVVFSAIPVLPPIALERIRAEPADVAILTDHTPASEYEVVLHGHPVSYARLSRIPFSEWTHHQSALYHVIEGNYVYPNFLPQEVQKMRMYIRENHFKYLILHGTTKVKAQFVEHVLSGSLIDTLGGVQVYQLYKP